MARTTIGGLFTNQARGETALAELQKANFSSAQISEVADGDDAPPPAKLHNPITDFFTDHTTTGSEFRDNLVSLGLSDKDAHYFEDGVARGGALVTVKADARAVEAVAILERNGADMGSHGRIASTAPPVATLASASAHSMDIQGDQTIQLRAERLAVEKIRVASGDVRIRKEVVTEQQSVDVVVSHDELVIERHPVTGAAAEVGGTIGADETISVPLSREEVKVGKQTFVSEEVDIGKRAVAETAHVSETVRHEELIVDADAKATPPLR